MEKASRTELLETINNQKEQLQLYKNKLRDVVAAYKSVVKEKEALEAGFSALNSASVGQECSTPSGNTRDKEDNSCAEKSADEAMGQTLEDPLGAHKKESKDDSKALWDQIRTLSTSLSTLTQEKGRIEANFIAERKQLKQELESSQAKLAEERRNTSKQVEGFEMQITHLKSKIRSQQLEREKEETDHALMLREIQALFASERSTKESLEVKLEEIQTMKESAAVIPDPTLVYEQQVLKLQSELSKVRDRLKLAEVKANEPSPFVLELQKEMANIKADYQRQVESERQKAQEAEARLRAEARKNEERVSSLEAKLSELSQVVGNYERTKFQDQQAISKLRERVTQLDLENTALARAASISPDQSDNTQENGHDPEQILVKIMQLRKQLKTASESSEKPISLASIFVEDLNKADEESPRCQQYKQELESLREEFERYKLRAQSVLKNKNKEPAESSKETEVLKNQISDLRDKLRMANFHHREETADFQNKIENLSKALLAQENKFKAEIAQIKVEHRSEMSQMELEARKQRDRTVSMLAEKDAELQRLRTLTGHSASRIVGYDSLVQSPTYIRSGSVDGNSVVAHDSDWHDSKNYAGRHLSRSFDDNDDGHNNEAEAVTKLLDLPKGVQNEAAFLHFAQERGRLEVVMSGLRRQKRELEMSYRDFQVSASQREERLKEEVNLLTERIAETDRHKHRGGANVEYLKNVLLQFLTSMDVEGKRSMLKALMTILQFSPRERQKVELAHSKGGWWGS